MSDYDTSEPISRATSAPSTPYLPVDDNITTSVLTDATVYPDPVSPDPPAPISNQHRPFTPHTVKYNSASQFQFGDYDRQRRLAQMGKDAAKRFIAQIGIRQFFNDYLSVEPPAGPLPDAVHRDIASCARRIKPGSESMMYKPLVRFYEACIEGLSKISQERLRLEAVDTHTGYEFGYYDESKCAADLALFLKDETSKRWLKAMIFIEVKGSASQDALTVDDNGRPILKDGVEHSMTLAQFEDYVRRVMRVQQCCSVICAGVFGDSTRLFRWDRCGCVVSEPFNYILEPSLFFEFLNRYTSTTREKLGVDPSLCRSTHMSPEESRLLERLFTRAKAFRILIDDSLPKEASTILVPHYGGEPMYLWERFITIGQPLFASKTLFGRATIVWLAFLPAQALLTNTDKDEDLDPLFRIVKGSWRDESRRMEGDIYSHIIGRSRTQPSGGTWLFGADDHVFGLARMSRDVNLAYNAVDTIYRTSCDTYCRTLDRRVLLSVGIPITRFDCTYQMIEALYDILRGLINMIKRNALHRDISVWNMMRAAFPRLEHHAKGFLIDMDYAALLEADEHQSLLEMTGTFPFLSIDRLEAQFKTDIKRRSDPSYMLPPERAHKACHDLESIFWALVFIVIRHRPTTLEGDPTPGETKVKIFDSGDPDSKIGFVNRIRKFEVVGNAPLTDLIRNLGRLVKSHYYEEDEMEELEISRDQLNKLTPERVEDLFKVALDRKKEWPKDDEAQPFTMVDTETKRSHTESIESMRSSSSHRGPITPIASASTFRLAVSPAPLSAAPGSSASISTMPASSIPSTPSIPDLDSSATSFPGTSGGMDATSSPNTSSTRLRPRKMRTETMAERYSSEDESSEETNEEDEDYKPLRGKGKGRADPPRKRRKTFEP